MTSQGESQHSGVNLSDPNSSAPYFLDVCLCTCCTAMWQNHISLVWTTVCICTSQCALKMICSFLRVSYEPCERFTLKTSSISLLLLLHIILSQEEGGIFPHTDLQRQLQCKSKLKSYSNSCIKKHCTNIYQLGITIQIYFTTQSAEFNPR